MEQRKSTEYLQYHFTDAELLDLAKTNARTQSEKRALENQKAQITKQLAGDIAAKDAELQKLSELVSNGYEYRQVECSIVLDMPVRGMATIIRDDTGEVVKERRMNDSEYQGKLPIDESVNVN